MIIHATSSTALSPNQISALQSSSYTVRSSGKTSITHKILKHEWVENCVHINPDEIAKDKFGDWNSREAIINAAIYSEELRENCIRNRQSLIFETVLSAPDKLNFIKKAKEQGFFIRLFFVGTASPKINASRIAQRVMNGGHDVPITKIISRYSKSIANCCVVVKEVDRVYVFDNSIEFKEPILLFRASNGIISKKYSIINNWALPIFNECEDSLS